MHTVFWYVPKSMTLNDLDLDLKPLAVITRYFTQYDSFQSQLHQIHWS